MNHSAFPGRHLRFAFGALISWLTALATLVASAANPNDGLPWVFALDPLTWIEGTTNAIKLRGLNLDSNTVVRLAGPGSVLVADVRVAKKADLPAGLEAREVGDARIDVELFIPAGVKEGELTLANVVGSLIARSLRVVKPGVLVEEKEPNGGFAEAQLVPMGSTVRGRIQSDKDVDVYRVAVAAGKKLVVEIRAARGGSMLDSMLFLNDAKSRLLTMNDDALGRDSRVEFRVFSAGDCYLTVLDAHDRGSEWHGYELTITEEP